MMFLSGNGIIEFPEFVDLMSRRPWGSQGSEEELQQAMQVWELVQHSQASS